MLRVLLLMLGLSALLGGCDIFNRWDALVYTNKFDHSGSIDIGTFDTLEECRAAAKAKLKSLKAGELGSYVCGQNCLVKTGFDNTRMCARTSK